MDTLRLMYQAYKEIGYRYAVACIIVGVVIGLVIGITVTLMAERCDYEAAMRPLVYVINQLSGGGR